MFLVTKLPPGGMYPEGVLKYMKKSLELLNVDYVDQYLIHVPFRFRDVDGDLHPFKSDGNIDMIEDVDHVAIWRQMEKLQEDGLARSIGVSNFNRNQLQRLLDADCLIKPVTLQIELHAYNQQKELLDYCKANGINVTAYSPLGSPGLGKFLAKYGQE